MIAALQDSSGLRETIAIKEKYEDGGHVQVCLSQHASNLPVTFLCIACILSGCVWLYSSSSSQNGTSTCSRSSHESTKVFSKYFAQMFVQN